MLENDPAIATIYTDGSCHTQLKNGGWAAIIFIKKTKTILQGTAANTTHNRMELTAVIQALKYLQQNNTGIKEVHVISDSQYVVGLTGRKEKLAGNNFITKKGNALQNRDLVKELLALAGQFTISFEKIKAHQQETDMPNYNIEVDKLARLLVRQWTTE